MRFLTYSVKKWAAVGEAVARSFISIPLVPSIVAVWFKPAKFIFFKSQMY